MARNIANKLFVRKEEEGSATAVATSGATRNNESGPERSIPKDTADNRDNAVPAQKTSTLAEDLVYDAAAAPSQLEQAAASSSKGPAADLGLLLLLGTSLLVLVVSVGLVLWANITPGEEQPYPAALVPVRTEDLSDF